MTQNIQTLDPRPLYRDALAWVRDLAAHVPAARLTGPTPCPEWDVRGLLGHLVATVDRARVIGEGGDPNVMPRVVAGVADDEWVDALAAAEDKAAAVWADDARLDAPVSVPWGQVPGRAALFGYLREALVHGGTWPSRPGRTSRPTRRRLPRCSPRPAGCCRPHRAGGRSRSRRRCSRSRERARRSSSPTGAGTAAAESQRWSGADQERGRRSDIGGSWAGARGVGNDSTSPVGT
jgi:hypothetical protein